MTDVFIGLGSNLGDGEANLLTAWRLIGSQAGINCRQLSGCYRTSPVDMESAQLFSNAVGRLETTLSPRPLLDRLLAIEHRMGRDRAQGRDRIIDLDILYFGTLRVKQDDLVIPHPEIARRLFVLAPLAELAPDLRHPLLGTTASELLATLEGTASGQFIEKSAWPKEMK